MFGRLYHIVVAAVAVSLVLALILGALFIVIQGLLFEFADLDLWTPLAELLAPLLEDLSALGERLWAWIADLWARALEALSGETPGPTDGDGES